MDAKMTALPLSEIPNDLAACENEPLRFIGSIQSVGCLLAFTAGDRRIQAASENVEDFLGVSHKRVMSEKLDHVLSVPIAERILSVLQTLSVRNPRVSFQFEHGDTRLDAVVYKTEELCFVEVEPSIAQDDHSETMNNALSRMRASTSLKAASTVVCEAIHRIIGMDRVMMYRFLNPHQHGEVIAEHRVLAAHSYYQQRFPASDIPQIARDLYLRNSVRQIPDVDLPTSRVLPALNPLTNSHLDLSDSRLRAVSPIHLEYLRNMNVRSSFSVAVIVDNRLWGLIACHHPTAKRFTVSQRTACDLLGNAFAGQARLIEETESMTRKIAFLTKMSDIFESIFTDASPDFVFRHQQIFDSFRAHGVAVVRGAHVDAAGLSPQRPDLQAYAQAFLQRMNDLSIDVLATDSTPKDFPELPQLSNIACGVLAVKISGDGVAFLFRPELIETISWAGDPRKQLERKKLGGRINPRTSFEAWEERISHHSLPWLDYEIEGLQKLKTLIFDRSRASK